MYTTLTQNPDAIGMKGPNIMTAESLEGVLTQMDRRLARLEIEVGLALVTIIGGIIAVLLK